MTNEKSRIFFVIRSEPRDVPVYVRSLIGSRTVPSPPTPPC